MMNAQEEATVFTFGDRTVLQLQSQKFEPLRTVAIPLDAVEALEEPAEDPIVRLEQKIDQALQAIAMLQHKIESLDVTLARVLSR